MGRKAKTEWDRFDEEAEREALAIKGSLPTSNPVGRKLTVRREQEKRASYIIQGRIERRYMRR